LGAGKFDRGRNDESLELTRDHGGKLENSERLFLIRQKRRERDQRQDFDVTTRWPDFRALLLFSFSICIGLLRGSQSYRGECLSISMVARWEGFVQSCGEDRPSFLVFLAFLTSLVTQKCRTKHDTTKGLGRV
jgi:hypothetical protein